MLKNQKRTMQLLMLIAIISWGSSWVNLKIVTTYINEFEALVIGTVLTIVAVKFLND